MDQHVPVGLGMDALAEGQDLLDMSLRAGLEAGILRHHVIEADQLVVDAGVAVERGRARLVGVDDRQDVADADGAVLRQLGNAADRDLEGRE